MRKRKIWIIDVPVNMAVLGKERAMPNVIGFENHLCTPDYRRVTLLLMTRVVYK
jgi:hypothetical protein